MTPQLTLDNLRASGLPLDWMTVYVAWQNAPNHPDISIPFSVYKEDVQSIALDALAVCSPSDEDALFRIADDNRNSVFAEDIKRYVGEFAAKSGVSENDALRKWRYLYLTDLPEILSQWILKERSPGGDYLPNVTDIDGETMWEIQYLVGQCNLNPEPPEIFGETRTETLQNLKAFRAWHKREKAELMQMPSVTAEGLPVSVPPIQ